MKRSLNANRKRVKNSEIKLKGKSQEGVKMQA